MNIPSCSVEGCTRAYRNSGFCNAHYLRKRRYGDPLLTKPRMTFRQRFDSKLVKGEAAGACWLWSGGHFQATGYAIFNISTGVPGRYVPTVAHRVAYELYVGPIPAGLVIDHLCRNRGCVNPDHLEPVPQRTNMLRGEAPSAIAVRTGACQRGHELTPENTFWRLRNGKTKRECRECIRARDRQRTRTPEYLARRRATYARRKTAS